MLITNKAKMSSKKEYSRADIWLVVAISAAVTIFLVVLFILIGSLYLPTSANKNISQELKNEPVVFATSTIEEVRGDSLSPMIKSGSKVEVSSEYYQTNPVLRDDLVTYKFGGDETPLIKIVKAVPGDKWSLKKSGAVYNILVNGKIIKNSAGEEYKIPEAKVKMLEIYIKNYPIIPSGAYLLLGDQSGGTIDATRFGLASEKDILGKAQVVK